MDTLSNSIYHYYLDHFDTLPLEKQLHFASRIYVWTGNDWSRHAVHELHAKILPGPIAETLRGIGEGTVLPLLQGSESLRAIRAPYFARYPELRRYAAMLYWAVLLEQLYGENARGALLDLVDQEDFERLYSNLLADSEAIAALSTYAVNFLYLYQRFVQRNEHSLSPDLFEKLATTDSDPDCLSTEDLRLKIYLLTHCVVADSLFYTRKLPAEHHGAYEQLLASLESMIDARFNDVNLDNKFEFLVCSRLAGRPAALEEEILNEARDSISPGGTYLIDTKNTNHTSTYTSLDKSEHRNVLFILSQTPYRG